MKKFTAIALTLALALTIAPASTAGAVDLEGMTVDELQALLTQLQAQLAEMTGTTPAVSGDLPAACAGISFSRNLALGTTGTDVKCLQAMLNMDPETQLAASGVGSAGQETEYFGSLTRAAVIKFQNKYASEVLTPIGLTAGTGFVGTQTIAKLNTMLTTAPTTPTTPTIPADTGDDEEGVEDGDEEGVEDDDEEYADVEGELEVKVTPSPINNQEIAWGSENVSVMGIELKAKHSPIKVSRIDIEFNNARPFDYINHLAIYDGENALAGKAVNSANLTGTGNTRTMRITGFDVTVPADGSKVLTVKVSNESRPRVTGSSNTLTITVKAGAVRGVDGAKLTQYNTGTAARTFYNDSAAEGAKLEVKINTNSPEEGIAITDEDSTTQHELLRFDVKATKNAGKITDIVFDATGSATGAHIVAYKLYDGSTLLGSESYSATPTFSGLEVEIAKDTTKTLRVEVEMNKAISGVTSSISISPTSTKITAESANDEAVTLSGSTVTGETIYFYEAAPVISNVTTDIKESTTTQIDGTINFTLTAQGGDIIVTSTAIGVNAATEGGVVSTGVTSSLIQVDGKTGTAVTITAGQSKNVTISATYTGGTKGKFYWFLVDSLKWTYDGNEKTMSGELIKDLKTDPVSWK
ncbi:MAG TPA: peptidoglycan-binding protein [Candidatus Pacearchaeota archaeon]|nr:peptidoglycan-binding protein [Candidatus Pacearchaeota archaeon]